MVVEFFFASITGDANVTFPQNGVASAGSKNKKRYREGILGNVLSFVIRGANDVATSLGFGD